MDKLAELVRDSEVRGAVAAFVDLGLVKVASQEAFDVLVDAVCRGIGDGEYDLQKVASVTEELLAESEQEVVPEGEQEKTALLGLSRTDDLTAKERAALIKHYGLPQDAYLDLRDRMRREIGAAGGLALGGALGTGLGMLGKHPVTGGILGSLVGTSVGAHLMAHKYSPENAREIMKMRQKTATATDEIAQKAALGELLQMKVAGQIDESSFIEAASSLLEQGAANQPMPGKRRCQ